MRAIWSERVPHHELWAAPTLALLRGRALRLRAAVTPPGLASAAELVCRCRDAGVALGLWPMLDDAHGRWASAWNGDRFADFTRRMLDALEPAGALPDELVLDLEPPIGWVRAALSGRPRPARPPPGGVRALEQLARDVRGRGLTLSVTALPLVAAPGRAGRGWQRALGAPLARLAPDRVNVMTYTSLVEGYSRRLLGRRDAEALLAAWAGQVAATWGAQAEVSVGCAGSGALGDEALYRSPDELARDVAIARAAGVDRIALFGLAGVLARAPAEAWLDALVDPPPPLSPPAPRPLRARVCLALASWCGRLAAGYGAA